MGLNGILLIAAGFAKRVSTDGTEPTSSGNSNESDDSFLNTR